MASLRGLIERLLPWYHPTLEEKRDARTERVVQRSEEARGKANRAIRAYRRADDASQRAGVESRAAGEELIDEIEKSP